MPITVFLSGDSREITINGADQAFEGTPLAGQSFWIKARTLTPVEEKRLEKEHIQVKRGDVRVDSAALLEKRFIAQVKDWGGLVDEMGVEIPCTDDIKRTIAKNDPALARDILSAINARAEEARKASQEELGN